MIDIGIISWGSISALGCSEQQVWESYLRNEHYFKKKTIDNTTDWVSNINKDAQQFIQQITTEKNAYKNLDPSVLYAIFSAREAVKNQADITDLGINIGSSRGATTLFENYHQQFLESETNETYPQSSPSTTLGNIASWVATDLNTTGPAISHSITCSTALHAIINAFVWIKSGYSNHFIAGGSEAPLTPFTLAQMKALKIYSGLETDFPCQAMNLDKKQSSMILGEGAASFYLSSKTENCLAKITGIGYGVESIKNGASLSAEAQCMQKAMLKALEGHDLESIDAIVLHSPGTVLGDKAEMKAIENVFGNHKPLLTCNKWKTGHTFGASGALSIEMALLMLKHNHFIQVPYLKPQQKNKTLNKVMVNAVGFGGNAASIILEK